MHYELGALSYLERIAVALELIADAIAPPEPLDAINDEFAAARQDEAREASPEDLREPAGEERAVRLRLVNLDAMYLRDCYHEGAVVAGLRQQGSFGAYEGPGVVHLAGGGVVLPEWIAAGYAEIVEERPA